MSTTLSRDREYSILFIGNSYTYFNSMPDIFARIADSCGYRARVDSITKGGYKLCKFADPTDEYGAIVEQRLSNESYDYVFLQEQSYYPCTETKKFNDGVAALAARVKAAGAKPLLYQTWGRKAGHSLLDEHGWTTLSMEGILRSAYKSAGEEVGARVAFVGAAFSEVYVSHPEIELYDPDLTHPSQYGSTLAAIVLFSTLFGVSPKEIPDTALGADPVYPLLRQAASKILDSDI